jgi:hypothetical protein
MSGNEYLAQLIGDTTWSSSERVNQWLNDRAAEGWQLVAMDNGAGFFVRALAAPGNVDVPHVSQTGDTLNCTMGNWTHDPTSYAYQWQLDGDNVGTDAPDYTRAEADVGKTATCVVTATNASGSTTAPPADSIVVT